MSSQETLREAFWQIANSPKVAVAAATSTTAIGALSSQAQIHGILVDASMFGGLVVTAILGCCHIVRFAILREELKKARAANLMQLNTEASK